MKVKLALLIGLSVLLAANVLPVFGQTVECAEDEFAVANVMLDYSQEIEDAEENEYLIIGLRAALEMDALAVSNTYAWQGVSAFKSMLLSFAIAKAYAGSEYEQPLQDTLDIYVDLTGNWFEMLAEDCV